MTADRLRRGLLGFAYFAIAAPLCATGPYMFGSFGAREISNQDMSDFFASGSQMGPQFVPSQLGAAALTTGYRFTDPFALEISGGAQLGREESNVVSTGAVDLQIPSGSLTLISVAPLFCFDTYGSVTSTWLHQIGFRLEYAEVSGVETLEAGSAISSVNFNGSTLGYGLFYRVVNLWAPARLSVGFEVGYDVLRFGNLVAGDSNGVFVGQPSRALENLNGVPAFLDNSGPYVRLLIGWDKDSETSTVSRPQGRAPAQTDTSPAARRRALAQVLAQARAARASGDNAAAVQLYRAYLTQQRTDPKAWRELGALYRVYGKSVFAQQCDTRAQWLEKHPSK